MHYMRQYRYGSVDIVHARGPAVSGRTLRVVSDSAENVERRRWNALAPEQQQWENDWWVDRNPVTPPWWPEGIPPWRAEVKVADRIDCDADDCEERHYRDGKCEMHYRYPYGFTHRDRKLASQRERAEFNERLGARTARTGKRK